MADNWWDIWGEVGERHNKTLNTGQPKRPFIGSIDRPDSFDITEKLDYTPKSLEPLYQKFNSPKNRGLGFKKRVSQKFENFEGLGPGHVTVTDDKKQGTKTTWVPYMGDKWVEKQNQLAAKAEFGANFFLHMAPIIALGTGGAALGARGNPYGQGGFKGAFQNLRNPKARSGPFVSEGTGPLVNMTKGQPPGPLTLKQNLKKNFSPTVYDPAGLAQLTHVFQSVRDAQPISKSRQSKLIEERNLQTANMATQNLKIDERKAKGKGYDTQARVMRRHQGTPTSTVGDLARPFVKASPVKDFSTRDVLVAYDKKTAAQKKEGAEIKKKFGLEATVDDHHIIQSFDSSEIGRLVREWNDPNEAADFYVWMVKEYKILSGDYDLNSAKLPTGPHRLKGGLHNVLKRFGFEDYWRELAVQNPMGLSKAELKVAFNHYADEVLYPTMRLMKELVEKHPAKGKFEHKGQYIPDYLVQDANKRLIELQTKYDPTKLRAGSGGRELAMEDLHTYASQQGWDTESRQWMDTEDGPIFSRPGFTKLPDEVESIWGSIMNPKPWKTR